MKIYMYRSDVSFPAGAGRRLSVDGRELEEAENGQQFISLEDHRKAVEEARRETLNRAAAAVLNLVAEHYSTRQDAEPQEASPDRET